MQSLKKGIIFHREIQLREQKACNYIYVGFLEFYSKSIWGTYLTIIRTYCNFNFLKGEISFHT